MAHLLLRTAAKGDLLAPGGEVWEAVVGANGAALRGGRWTPSPDLRYESVYIRYRSVH